MNVALADVLCLENQFSVTAHCADVAFLRTDCSGDPSQVQVHVKTVRCIVPGNFHVHKVNIYVFTFFVFVCLYVCLLAFVIDKGRDPAYSHAHVLIHPNCPGDP